MNRGAFPHSTTSHPYAVPVGRKSREGSMFSNGDPNSYAGSTPISPIDSPYTPGGRHAFSPLHSSGLSGSFQNQASLATSFASNSFNANMSTTPLDTPPIWAQNGASLGGIDWNSALNTTTWPEISQNEQQPRDDDFDPALFETLAELIEQSQQSQMKANGNSGTFDFMGALSQAASPQAAPMAPPPQTGAPTMSQSLLSRRMQHTQGQNIPQPNQSLFNVNNLSGSAPSVTQTPGSLSGSFGNPSVASSTPPQTYGNNMAAPRMSMSSQIPNSAWPVPDRGMAYSDTFGTTPSGSDYGVNSPLEVGFREGGADRQMPGGSSRSGVPPIMPIRREAPQNPAPQQSPLAHSFGSSALSSSVPKSSSRLAGTSVPRSVESPIVDMSSLPPLPPGFSLEQLGQMGAAGFEMAIRMGMGLAMGMNQANQAGSAQPGSFTNTPSNPVVSGHGSLATSPTEIPKQSDSPNIVSNIMNEDMFPKRSSVAQFGSTPPVDSPAPGTSLNSRRPSQGEQEDPLDALVSPEDAAKKDPLAAQVWKAYAKARETLPNGQRMENLTWRMMHLTLKKQEELAAAAAAKELHDRQQMMYNDQQQQRQQQEQREQQQRSQQHSAASTLQSQTATPSSSSHEGEQRGRRQGKSRVVGFQNQKSQSPAPE